MMRAEAMYSPLALAYIGDSVHTLYVRERILEKGDRKAHDLHVLCSRYVKAASQARAIHFLMPFLTEEETEIYKRGRNAKSATVPKNAEVADYRAATGFEALVGALYLNERYERLYDILSKSMEITETEDK